MNLDLGANDLQILMADSPQEAPNYEKPEHLLARLKTAFVVGHGTVAGNPTVDLVFEDESGQKYVAMITGGIIESLAGCVAGVRERTRGT